MYPLVYVPTESTGPSVLILHAQDLPRGFRATLLLSYSYLLPYSILTIGCVCILWSMYPPNRLQDLSGSIPASLELMYQCMTIQNAQIMLTCRYTSQSWCLLYSSYALSIKCMKTSPAGAVLCCIYFWRFVDIEDSLIWSIISTNRTRTRRFFLFFRVSWNTKLILHSWIPPDRKCNADSRTSEKSTMHFHGGFGL